MNVLSCLIVRNLAVTIERLHQPNLRSEPLILLTGNKRLRVLAVDNLAYETGVEIGITQKQAELLCPTANAFRARDDVYRRVFDEMTAALLREIGKLEAVYHPRNALWYVPTDKVQELLVLQKTIETHLGIQASIGCGSNKFIARVASAGSNEIWYKVKKGDEVDFLAPYPVTLLPLNKDMQRRLPMMGIQTMGQYATLSRAAVFEQWGKDGRWCHDLAKGIDPRPLQSYQVPSVITKSFTFDEPVLDKQILISVCIGVIPDMMQQLNEREARKVILMLECDDKRIHEVHLEPNLPIRDMFQLHRQLPFLLDKPQFTTGILRLALQFIDIAGVIPTQLSLFDFAQKKQSLDKAIIEWQDRFHETLYHPILRDVPSSFPPELQIEYEVVSA